MARSFPLTEHGHWRHALGLLAVGVWRWRRLQQLKEDRGTAYVITEERIGWHHEERSWVLGEIGSGFASVLRVPGPAELGRDWRWQTDAAHAPQWNERLDELVRSFWSVHYNDDQATHNAVFVWAPWGVAMAFGMRATALRRGLVLRVRQRPSYGAAGTSPRLGLQDRAHTFLEERPRRSLSSAAPLHVWCESAGEIDLVIDAAPAVSPGMTDEQAADALAAPVPQAAADAVPLLVLVVRVIPGSLGGFPPAGLPDSPVRIVVHPACQEGLPPGRRKAQFGEWSLLPRTGDRTADERLLPWEGFDSVAAHLADWVAAQARAHPEHTVLLAARIPQELAVGLGIRATQLGARWPLRILPLQFDAVYAPGGGLLYSGMSVPRLDLGAAAVPVERVMR